MREIERASYCIDCGKCQESCNFLKKYKMNLRDFSEHPELAYSCFMCGECSRVCPEDIRGEGIAQEHRIEIVKREGERIRKDYRGMLWEKEKYRFANYRRLRGRSAMMPGCNFSGFLPKTTAYLEKLLGERGIGTLYECCRKPVYELGFTDSAEEQLQRLEQRLRKAGVEELILLCPNCYHFLKGRLSVSIVDIYEKLRELKLGRALDRELPIYFPCPDRKGRELFRNLRYFLPKGVREIEGQLQCCGLGGSAGRREPELAAEMPEKLRDSLSEERLYTYCGTCTGRFQRKGLPVYHVLSKILGIEERIPGGAMPLWHRAKYSIL